jgi:hypothetical protein
LLRFAGHLGPIEVGLLSDFVVEVFENDVRRVSYRGINALVVEMGGANTGGTALSSTVNRKDRHPSCT